jgi:hypothetical protein
VPKHSRKNKDSEILDCLKANISLTTVVSLQIVPSCVVELAIPFGFFTFRVNKPFQAPCGSSAMSSYFSFIEICHGQAIILVLKDRRKDFDDDVVHFVIGTQKSGRRLTLDRVVLYTALWLVKVPMLVAACQPCIGVRFVDEPA